MKRRFICIILSLVLLLSLLPSNVFAAQGDLPTTMYIAPSEALGIPAKILLNQASSSSSWGSWGGGSWGGGGSSSSSKSYQLYLPGCVDASACFFSWEDGLLASDGEDTFESGTMPIPAPGETKTYTFTKGSETKTFKVTTWQGTESVRPIFIEIDESLGTISAMNKDSEHETTCSGIIYIDGEKHVLESMKGRGNSSWMMANTKKPYNVTLGEKVNILGIDSDKTRKWSFLANSNEPSIIRNKLGYDMAHAMGVGLDSAYADVWMNGKYLGTYMITPKTDSFVTKDGFLLENDNYKEDPISEGGDPSFDLDGLIGQGSSMSYYNYNRITVKKIGSNFLGGEENEETLTDAQERIRVYMQEVWDAIRSEDGYNSQGGYYADYVDMRSWACMYLMEEYVKNYDFCGGSLFFHRDGTKDSDKLFAGPIWDLDIGFGCTSNSSSLGSSLDLLSGTGWFIRNVSENKTSMYKYIGMHEDFMEEVARQYSIYHEVFENAPAYARELAESIRASALMNEKVTANESGTATNLSRETKKNAGTEYEQVYKATTSWDNYVDNVITFASCRSLFFSNNFTVQAQEGYEATFDCGQNSSVTVYPTQDTQGEGIANAQTALARNSESGEVDVTGEGQINFTVQLKNGYELKRITVEPAENYKNLKTPTDTGIENCYRITKVTGPVTVTIETETDVCAHEFAEGICKKCGAKALKVSFDCTHASVTAYESQAEDSPFEENAAYAYARSSSTGSIDISGEGQVNFTVKPDPGYEIESVTAEPTGSFKNLKLPAETGSGYRVTKITADVTVHVVAKKSTCEHDYKAVVTPATCTEKGYTTYTCTKCGDSYVAEETALISHHFVDGVCTACGAKALKVRFSCEHASVTVYESQAEDSPFEEKAAYSYARAGDTGLIDCSGEGQVNFAVVPEAGYEIESVTAEPTGSFKNLKLPAETGTGYRVTKITADVTVHVVAKKSACEHDYKAVVTPATCTEKGYTTYTCTKCGDSYQADEVAPLGHDLKEAKTAATCTKSGTITKTCTRCDYRDVAELPALGHDYKSAVTAPTCIEKGYTTYTCTRCADSYQANETTALGHNWDEGRITKAATETETGEKTFTCTRCGAVQVESIPTLLHEHSYQAVITKPSCTQIGYTTYTCTGCGDSYHADETPALGHNLTETKVEPTCTAAGSVTKKCTRCDYEEATELAPLGHDYQDGVCKRCGDRLAKEPCDGGADCPSKCYTDAPAATSWAHEGIDYCITNKLMNGTSATLFSPNGTLTRGQLVTILYRMAESPEVTFVTRFTDVAAGRYYSDAVIWAANNEIVTGYKDGTFKPDDQITREQIATILYRYSDSPEVEGDLTAFPDYQDVSSYAKNAMIWATANGLITGVKSGEVSRLAPKAFATRAQIASIIMRYLVRA